MRRIIVAVSLIISLAVAGNAAAVGVQVTAPSNEVAAGATVPITVEISNPSGVVVTGNLAIWMLVTNAIIVDAVSSTPTMVFARELIDNTVEYFVGRAPDFELDPDETVTATVNIAVPADAPQGAKVEFTASGFLGDTSGSGQVSIVIRGTAAPQLKIEIVREQLAYDDGSEEDTLPIGVVRYKFRITNEGSEATTGPVDVDVTRTFPQGLVATPRASDEWLPAGSLLRYKIMPAIAPGATVEPPALNLELSGNFYRGGSYGITALAAGGGSPPDEATDQFTILELDARRFEGLTFDEILARINDQRGH